MSNTEKRRQLFELCSKNLSIHVPQYQGSFVCPICLDAFGSSALEDQPPLVDLAHVLPKSAGGKLKTLTCAACNSKIGTKYDSHLAIEQKMAQAADPATSDSYPMRWGLPGVEGDLGVLYSKQGDEHRFFLNRNLSHPNALKQLDDGLTPQSEGTWKFTVFDPSKQKASLLHSAFLLLFYEFGYEFAATPLANRLRNILLGTSLPPEPFLLIDNLNHGEGDPSMVNRIALVTSSAGRFLVALLPPITSQHVARLVWLPGLDEQSERCYEALINRRVGDTRFHFQAIGGNPEMRVARPAFRYCLRGEWAGFTHDEILAREVMNVTYQYCENDSTKWAKASEIAGTIGLPPSEVERLISLLRGAAFLEADPRVACDSQVRLTNAAHQKFQEIPDPVLQK